MTDQDPDLVATANSLIDPPIWGYVMGAVALLALGVGYALDAPWFRACGYLVALPIAIALHRVRPMKLRTQSRSETSPTSPNSGPFPTKNALTKEPMDIDAIVIPYHTLLWNRLVGPLRARPETQSPIEPAPSLNEAYIARKKPSAE
ncbi:MAG: hypothetical protein Q8Q09_08705 [Deltaproteobacteria bacterium]|nr:hypothetical protein [Deltaproteobacteria bacterium]